MAPQAGFYPELQGQPYMGEVVSGIAVDADDAYNRLPDGVADSVLLRETTLN